MPDTFAFVFPLRLFLLFGGWGGGTGGKGTININNTKGRKGGNNTKTHTTQRPHMAQRQNMHGHHWAALPFRRNRVLLECPVWPGHKARSSLLDVERARSSEGFVVLVDVDLYVDIMIKKELFTLEDNIKGLQY